MFFQLPEHILLSYQKKNEDEKNEKIERKRFTGIVGYAILYSAPQNSVYG